ncbi:MAG: hypothetical protein JJ979_02695 [Roseibium sp.]|nr:hypothetical protein [Roseibium sp.]
MNDATGEVKEGFSGFSPVWKKYEYQRVKWIRPVQAKPVWSCAGARPLAIRHFVLVVHLQKKAQAKHEHGSGDRQNQGHQKRVADDKEHGHLQNFQNPQSTSV